MVERNKPINLGVSVPDFDAYPQTIIEAMRDIVLDENTTMHQMTKITGHPRLVNVLAKLYSQLLNNKVTGDNILITCGAFEALYCAIHSIINHGDEAIIIDPAYDEFEVLVKGAGGVPVHTCLKRTGDGTDWQLDLDDLEAKITDRTRLLTRLELEAIGQLCLKHNFIAVSDEVFEWLTYDGRTHHRIASLPGMYDRCVTIGSLGKACHVTGWRCGWAIAGNPVVRMGLVMAHMSCANSMPTIIQEAAARFFELELPRLGTGHSPSPTDNYWSQVTQMLDKKRHTMYGMLLAAGLTPMLPEGGFTMLADCTKLIDRLDLTEYADPKGKTVAFVRWLSA
ncbi:unnamed protein product, partial [Medioppia subpectinata]